MGGWRGEREGAFETLPWEAGEELVEAEAGAGWREEMGAVRVDGFEEGVGFEEVVGEETGFELGASPACGFGGGPCLADGVVHVGSEDDWFGAEVPRCRVVEGWFEDPDIEA